MRFLWMPVVAASLMLTASVASAEGPSGKTIFTDQQCAQCHAIASQGIKSDGDAPDLSKVGATFDAAAIEQILLKQKDINGKKHKKKFQGTPDELKQLSAWLASLK
jgi:mono/diheme cytochrome c family protein